ncbi:DsbA family oxidoreductase [Gordonia sp. DT30]|uniref:DsbA family oxidoreductase n=1 Tax=unclassified Gordonia (in: high G+C Gram-positive bacteria) TaxID=2657482 RepID=UPI003CE9C7E9
MTRSTPTQTSAAAPQGKRLQIDVWGDLACPWCYIGKNRLDQAIGSSPYAEAITVKVRSFELDPGMPAESKPNLELLRAKYGLSPTEAMGMEEKVAAIAHHEGLPYTGDRVLSNSFDVHRVLHLADTFGLAGELLGDLQRALFSGRADVYDHIVLADHADRLGIPRSRVEAVLSGDEFADTVRADETEARELGITGVPFTVFDGRIAVAGSTDSDGYAEAINRAWSTE